MVSASSHHVGSLPPAMITPSAPTPSSVIPTIPSTPITLEALRSSRRPGWAGRRWGRRRRRGQRRGTPAAQHGRRWWSGGVPCRRSWRRRRRRRRPLALVIRKRRRRDCRLVLSETSWPSWAGHGEGRERRWEGAGKLRRQAVRGRRECRTRYVGQHVRAGRVCDGMRALIRYTTERRSAMSAPVLAEWRIPGISRGRPRRRTRSPPRARW